MTIATGRRTQLALPLALALASAACPARAQGASHAQAPGFHRRRVGDVEVTALLDGFLDLPTALFDLPPDHARALQRQAFLPDGPLATPVTAFALRRGSQTVLVDAGTVPGFAPGVARLPDALLAAGIAPASVGTVLLTHLHPDHAGGLVRDGRAAFPDAEIVLAEAELRHWTDDGAMARMPAGMAPLVGLARGSITPYRGRVRPLASGARPLDWIEAVPLPGHTPGHTGWLIADGGDRLLLAGDVVTAAALQMPRPEAALPDFDTDPAAAVATRRRMLDMAAAERLPIAGTHLPFPGFGHVRRVGSAFDWAPAPWRPL